MLRRLTIRPAAACALGALAFPFPARCADRNDKPLGAWPIQSIEDALPVASVATFGGMSGYASGFALKKARGSARRQRSLSAGEGVGKGQGTRLTRARASREQMGKVALGALGGVFCLFQVAAYYGYVKVDMAKVERDFTAVLDVNKDGKVDQDDLRAMFGSTIDVLTANTDLSTGASAGGFTGGFALGLRHG